MSPIRVGIVGGGFAAGSHAEALRRLTDVEVVGIATSSARRSQDAAARLGIPQAFSGYEELISSSDVDVVHNCTPNYLHREVSRAALGAGKHLLSEKPLAMNSDETAELARLAGTTDVVTGLCHNYRHYPLVRQMRDMLASDLGTPHFIHGAYLQDWLLHDDDWNWRLDPIQGGDTRAVADIGSHWIDLVQHVTASRVTSVCARFGRLHEQRLKPTGEVQTFEAASGASTPVTMRTEDLAGVLLEFDNGATGSLAVSQVSPGRKNALTVEIDTLAAALSWDQEDPNHLWIGHRDRANSDLMRDPGLLDAAAARLVHYPGGHEEGWADGLKNLMLDFYGAVSAKRDGRAYRGSFATFDDGHHLTRVVEAIFESDRSRRWVEVEGEDR